jgi:putative cardiolipin synthase
VSESDLSATLDLVNEQMSQCESELSHVLEGAGDFERVMSAMKSLDDQAISIAFDIPSEAHDPQPAALAALREVVAGAKSDLVVATPFFVPADIDVAWYRGLVDRGVRIRILTNSLASNPGTVSNSWLNKTRAAMVEGGVEIYELQPDSVAKPAWEVSPHVGRYLGLHMKLFVIDDERVFLGSLNLDPRSKFINTEMVVTLDDVDLARQASELVLGLTSPDSAWRVEAGLDGELRWVGDGESLTRQPARSSGQRIADRILSLLPVREYI